MNKKQAIGSSWNKSVLVVVLLALGLAPSGIATPSEDELKVDFDPILCHDQGQGCTPCLTPGWIVGVVNYDLKAADTGRGILRVFDDQKAAVGVFQDMGTIHFSSNWRVHSYEIISGGALDLTPNIDSCTEDRLNQAAYYYALVNSDV